jgi:hypothetical protein
MSLEPNDDLIRFLRGDTSMLKCTVCGTTVAVGCDCWTKCPLSGCTWSFLKGKACRNPAHKDTRP